MNIMFWLLFGVLIAWITTIATTHASHIKVYGLATSGTMSGGLLLTMPNNQAFVGFNVYALLGAVCTGIIALFVGHKMHVV